MQNKTFATYTLGCKVNQYETNAVEEVFIEDGFTLTDFDEKADVYIINTCTVTAMSDKKSRQIIRRAKKQNKNSLVVVIGCYSQISPDEVAKIEDVNLVMGTSNKKGILQEVKKLKLTDKVIKVNSLKDENEFENLDTKAHSKNQRAFLKIQDGCDRYCSYCIIPYTRGKVRSRRKEDILKEIEELSKNDYKEVVLTGIHVASYGKDFRLKSLKEQENVNDINENYLLDVIESIAQNDGIKRIRIGSLEPVIITDNFLEKLTKIEKFCPHFHLSLQSGCDETLSRMNRRYTTEEYEESVNKIRKYFDNPAITTDVIVGFPGETEEEFNKTFDYLKKIKLYQMHIFPFSRRSGTKAHDMPNQIPEQIKHTRVEILKKLDEQNRDSFENNMIGKIEQVLFEQRAGEYFEGHTKNYVKLYMKTEQDLSGILQNVLIYEKIDDRLICKK